MTSTSWLDLVPVSAKYYAYQADLYCEDCGAKIAESLDEKGVRNTGDTDDYPQGPFGDEYVDNPAHCGSGDGCVNAIQIPSGRKIGCPLNCTLTKEGVEYARSIIAQNLFYGSSHQKGVELLWRRLFSDQLDDGDLIRLSLNLVPVKVTNALLREGINLPKDRSTKILPSTFTDLFHVYGAMMTPSDVCLWRLDAADNGKLENLKQVGVPTSLLEFKDGENNLQSVLNEAIDDGAFE
jgi:hypothetical protein